MAKWLELAEFKVPSSPNHFDSDVLCPDKMVVTVSSLDVSSFPLESFEKKPCPKLQTVQIGKKGGKKEEEGNYIIFMQ